MAFRGLLLFVALVAASALGLGLVIYSGTGLLGISFQKTGEEVADEFRAAVQRGDLAALNELEELLDGALLNQPHGGMTPLMQAADAGHPGVVRWLLERRADPNVSGLARRTPLQYAVNKGRRAIAVALLDAGADVDGADAGNLTPLVMAANRNHPTIAHLLLDRGANVNTAHRNGFTALIDASNHGRTKLVKRLIDLGADVNAVTKDGWCALHYAIAKNHRQVVDALLEAGADINVQARTTGETPLDLAIKHKHEQLRARLEGLGAVRGRSTGEAKQ